MYSLSRKKRTAVSTCVAVLGLALCFAVFTAAPTEAFFNFKDFFQDIYNTATQAIEDTIRDIYAAMNAANPSLFEDMSQLPTQIGGDLAHFGAESVRPNVKTYKFGSDSDLANNDYAIRPGIPTHGKVKYYYHRFNGSDRIANCISVLGIPTKYYYGRASVPVTPPVSSGTTQARSVTTYGRWYGFQTTFQCLNDPHSFSTEAGPSDSAASVATWDILVQGGRDLRCSSPQHQYGSDDCNYFMPELSSKLADKSNSFQYHNSTPWMDVAWAIPTDDTYTDWTRRNDDLGYPWSYYYVGQFGTVKFPTGFREACTTNQYLQFDYNGNPSYQYRLAYGTDGWLKVDPNPEYKNMMYWAPCIVERDSNDFSVHSTDQNPLPRIYHRVVYVPWRTVCSLDRVDRYTFACLDPRKVYEFAAKLASRSGSPYEEYNSLFAEFPQSYDMWRDDKQFESLVTYGQAIYQSTAHGLEQFFDISQRLSPVVRQQLGIPLRNQTYASVGFYVLPTTGLYPKYYSALVKHSTWTSTAYLYFGRIDSKDALMRSCPLNKNGTQYCNHVDGRDENVCTASGVCMCDLNWLGDACDIPWPRKPDGTRFTAYEVLTNTGDSDIYEVCSRRGAPHLRKTISYYRNSGADLIVSYAQNTPICECAPGFRGGPDNWEDLPLYASMFHSAYIGIAVHERGGSLNCYRTDYWATDLVSTQFRSEKFVVNITSRDNRPCTAPGESQKYIASFPYDDVMMTRQCLLYVNDVSIPNLQVQFDYKAFPFSMGQLNEDAYARRRVLYPVPSSSERRRKAADFGHTNPHADGRQEIKCWDYKEFNWDSMTTNTNSPTTGIGKIADLVKFLRKDPRWGRTIVNTTLFGGKLCRPCPDCNRTNSICMDSLPISKSSSTYCHCDDNYCGPTCDIQVCPVYRGKVCGNGKCKTETDVPTAILDDGKELVRNMRCTPGFPRKCQDSTWYAARCSTLKAADNQLSGSCECDNGYEGADCSRVVCPLGLDNKVCSGSARGTCNHVSRKCDCVDQFGGTACERAACPRHPVTKEECSGATAHGTSNSVCNTAVNPPVCKCYETTPDLSTSSDTTLVDRGYPAAIGYTNTQVYLTGRWGTACERNFTEQCMDSHGSWCGQKINSNGVPIESAHDGYAGCFNRTCRSLGAGAAGLECKPTCQCTLEFNVPTDPYCTTSVCGPDRCDTGNGTVDSGDCVLTCSMRGSSDPVVPCPVPSLNSLFSPLVLRSSCRCKVANGTYWFKKTADPNSIEPCEARAPECYSGEGIPPCHGNGLCIYNTSTSGFTCLCNTGYSGSNCSIAPVCLTPAGQTCNSPTQFCFKNGDAKPHVCSCLPTYLRDTNRTCTQERCLTTGGTLNPDRTCKCPVEEFYSDVPHMPTDVTQTQMGCRKGCPVSPSTGVPCGSLEFGTDASGINFRRSRCGDLLNGSAIFRDSSSPAPSCVCDFRGVDGLGKQNYFIDDPDNPGTCKPKCNPSGLCVGSDCKGRGTLSPSNACNCGPNWKGSTCYTPDCSGNKNPLRYDLTTCTCKLWCYSGSDCGTDLCAESGGVCNPSNPVDCDCSGNSFLALNVTAGGPTTQRRCVSKCQNGGYLNVERTGCECPFPYTGDLCEKTFSCPVQWEGIFCNQSRCQNGGTPRPLTESGCICLDAFYQGSLCEIDTCTASVNTVRANASRCICATGYTGEGCTDTLCGKGGYWNSRTGECICFYGYTLAANRSACLIDANLAANCDQGTYTAISTGGYVCRCDLGFSGPTCNVSSCSSPQVPVFQYPDGTVVCACPASTQGVGCQQSLCTAHATGTTINPVTGATECECLPGYAISEADGNGVFQCALNAQFCSIVGSDGIDFSDPLNPGCTCKEGFYGAGCGNMYAADETASETEPWASPTRLGIIIGTVIFCAMLAGFYCWHRSRLRAIAKTAQYQPLSGNAVIE